MCGFGIIAGSGGCIPASAIQYLRKVDQGMANRFSAVLLVVVAVMVMATALPLLAADAPQTVGCADYTSIWQSYDKQIRYSGEIEAYGKQLQENLLSVSECKLLTSAELTELYGLLTKTNATDKDKERIKQLQDQEKALDAELKDLQSKKDASNPEKARQKELQDRQASSDETMQKLLEQAKGTFDDKNKTLTTEVRNDILKAIEDVSKQKGLTMVIDKNGMLYGGVDITQQVTDKLNGKKK